MGRQDRELGSRLTHEEVVEIVRAIRPRQSIREWFADDALNRAGSLTIVLLATIAAGVLGFRYPYDNFTRIPRANSVLANVVLVLMCGVTFLPLVWFDIDLKLTGWGMASRLGGRPRHVGWFGIILMLIVAPILAVIISIVRR